MSFISGDNFFKKFSFNFVFILFILFLISSIKFSFKLLNISKSSVKFSFFNKLDNLLNLSLKDNSIFFFKFSHLCFISFSNLPFIFVKLLSYLLLKFF